MIDNINFTEKSRVKVVNLRKQVSSGQWRMFTPVGSKYPGGGRSRPGSRSGTPLSGARRTVGTPLLTGRLKTSANTPVSSRSQVLETTSSHVVSQWGSSLPVMVTEVLV